MIAPPVRAGDLHQLEGGADIGGGAHVRPAAQIDPVPLAVQSDGFRRRQVLDELGLVFLALGLEEGDGFLAVDHAALEPGAAADNVAHFQLDGGEVVRRERLIAGEIVVEAVLDRWADGDLGAGIQILHRLGQHVGGVVTDHVQRLGVAARDEHQRASRSIAVARSTVLPSSFIARAARARPGPIAAATSVPVTGASNWRTEPSGRVMAGMGR